MAWGCEDAKRKITEILCFSFSQAQEKKNRDFLSFSTPNWQQKRKFDKEELFLGNLQMINYIW